MSEVKLPIRMKYFPITTIKLVKSRGMGSTELFSYLSNEKMIDVYPDVFTIHRKTIYLISRAIFQESNYYKTA